MKDKILQIITLCLCVVLLVVVILQGKKLEEFRLQTENDMENLKIHLTNEIAGVGASLEQTLQSAGLLVSSCEFTPAALDAQNEAVIVDASLRLKTWDAETAVTLQAELGGEDASFPMTHDGSGNFTAQLSLPLGSDSWYAFDALIVTGGAQTIEPLESWVDLQQLLPLRAGGYTNVGPTYENGVLKMEFSLCLEGMGAGITQPQFQVYRNGELAQTLEAETDPNTLSDSGHYYRPAGGGTVSVECSEGDDVEVFFLCVDEHGLGYEFPCHSYYISDDPEGTQVGGGCTFGDGIHYFWP